MLHISRQEALSIRAVMPQSHWDDMRQLFFRPLYGDTLPVMAAFCTISLGGTLVFVAVCVTFYDDGAKCQLFNTSEYPQEAQWLSSQRRLRNTVTWEDVQIYVPSILGFGTSATVHDRGVAFSVSISLEKCIVEHISNREIHSLTLKVEKLEKAIRPDQRGEMQEQAFDGPVAQTPPQAHQSAPQNPIASTSGTTHPTLNSGDFLNFTRALGTYPYEQPKMLQPLIMSLPQLGTTSGFQVKMASDLLGTEDDIRLKTGILGNCFGNTSKTRDQPDFPYNSSRGEGRITAYRWKCTGI
jgi:hypothetical protein